MASQEWKHERLILMLRELTSRLPARRGAGKITAELVRLFPAPPRTLREFSVYPGMAMRVDVGMKYERSMFFSPQLYEFREMKLLRDVLRPGDTVVDVGANVGLYTLTAATIVGPTGRVIAVEPDPEIFERLSWSVRQNGFANVSLVQAAISDRNGDTVLYRDASDNTGANSLSAGVVSAATPIPVRTMTLDELLREQSVERVSMLKMDIEGWEVRALQSSRLLLQTPRPLMMIEADDRLLNSTGTSKAELVSMLEAAQFEVNALDHRNVCAK